MSQINRQDRFAYLYKILEDLTICCQRYITYAFQAVMLAETDPIYHRRPSNISGSTAEEPEDFLQFLQGRRPPQAEPDRPHSFERGMPVIGNAPGSPLIHALW